MAVQRPDPLCDALSGMKVDSRLINWLWLFFKNHRLPLDPGEFQSQGMNHRMAEFINQNQNLKSEIEAKKNSLFLPGDQFQWIADDKRQNKWLYNLITSKTGLNQVYLPPLLNGRNLIIAMIDTWSIDPNQKLNEIKYFEFRWSQQKRLDHIFRWFNDENEAQKCNLAWELITK